MMCTNTTVLSSCATCATKGLTCCYYRNDARTDTLLPISYTECKIVCDYLGISSIETCFEQEIVTEHFQNNMKKLFPEEEDKVEKLFPVGEERWRFALRGEIKHCVFLTSRGCFLPRNIRPVLCALFPFWVYNTGEISLFGNCALAPKNVPLHMSVMNASSSFPELYALHALLRNFWGFI